MANVNNDVTVTLSQEDKDLLIASIKKSDANVRKLQGITSQYDCYDYDFKNHADQGIW